MDAQQRRFHNSWIIFEPTNIQIKIIHQRHNNILKKIEGIKNLPDNTILATLDVASLYSNIDTNFSLQAARETLEKTRPNSNVEPSNASLLELLEMVLTKSNF